LSSPISRRIVPWLSRVSNAKRQAHAEPRGANQASGIEPLLLWDERLTGFGLAAYASGTKRYIIQFRVKGSRRSRRMVIGSAARLDLEVAASAKGVLGHVDLGRDPLAEQLSQRSGHWPTPTSREASKIRTAEAGAHS
jgi:hypothetical protein